MHLIAHVDLIAKLPFHLCLIKQLGFHQGRILCHSKANLMYIACMIYMKLHVTQHSLAGCHPHRLFHGHLQYYIYIYNYSFSPAGCMPLHGDHRLTLISFIRFEHFELNRKLKNTLKLICLIENRTLHIWILTGPIGLSLIVQKRLQVQASKLLR